MQQARHPGTGADHWLVVGCFSLDAAPAANDGGVTQYRYQFDQMAECGKGGGDAWSGSLQGQIANAATATKHDIAALDLTGVEASTDYPEAEVHDRRQRLGHTHIGIDRLLGNLFAKLLGDLFAPGTTAIEQETTAHTLTGLCLQHEIVAIEATLLNGVLLQ